MRFATMAIQKERDLSYVHARVIFFPLSRTHVSLPKEFSRNVFDTLIETDWRTRAIAARD